ncbi:MAG: thiosulfate oxidation carrier protein SoxY [Betaproteobacteria bacterium]
MGCASSSAPLALSRREGLGGLLACLCLAGKPVRAQAPPVNLDWPALYTPHTGGQIPTAAKVLVETPRLADNGLSVPLKISIDHPMRQDNFIKRVVLLSNRNPRTLIAEFELSPWAGKAEIATRVRLNGSQEVMALAQGVDGRWWEGRAQVEVTESACLDEA